MPDRRIDLYLGSDIGAWALERVAPARVGQVITDDEAIAALARARGLAVFGGDAHDPAGGFASAQRGLSVHYAHLFAPELIARYERLYNLHPGHLPWGRGFYPIFWALWEGTTAGATLHEIDAGVDTGPIVAQREVSHDDSDTGASLYGRVREAECELLDHHIDALIDGDPAATPQQPGEGSYHSRLQFLDLRSGREWRERSAEQLVRLARCLSFPGQPGVEIESGGTRFELRLDPKAG